MEMTSASSRNQSWLLIKAMILLACRPVGIKQLMSASIDFVDARPAARPGK
jgi:hypothetical protein